MRYFERFNNTLKIENENKSAKLSKVSLVANRMRSLALSINLLNNK
jgi:hypothetical protein